MTKIIAWGGIILSVILEIWICSWDSEFVLLGLIVMIAGSFISWLSVLRSYAFGQLVDNSLVALAERESKRASLTQDKVTRVNTTVPQAVAPVQQKVQQPLTGTLNVYAPAVTYCPKCGTKQRANRTVCMACGVFLSEQ